MPRYSYKAVSLEGENVDGEYTAPDKSGVIAMLRQGGYYPLTIKLLREDTGRTTKKKVGIKHLAGFCSQMAAMLHAGVPVAKALEILKEQTDDKTLRLILDDVFSKVQRGNRLSSAFVPYKDNFPIIFLNMVEAGEASGQLDLCLERAGVTFTRAAKLSGKLKTAMVYPAVILALMVGIVVLLLVFVIPSFVEMFESNNTALPGITRALIGVSDFMINRWYIVASGAVVIIISAKLVLDSDGGRTAIDKLKLNMPVIGKLMVKVYAARYARTLASLSAAGVPLTQALTITARSLVNKYFEKQLYTVVDSVNQGEELSAALGRMGTLPPMIVYMTRLGEESGKMDTLLEQAAEFYDNESDTALQMLTALLEPAMIILMAIVVLPVVLAIIMPMFSMYNMS